MTGAPVELHVAGIGCDTASSRWVRERLSHVIVFRAPRARSLAWLERPADNREVASPNLAGPTPGLASSSVGTLMASSISTPQGSDRRSVWFLVAVLGAVLAVMLTSYVVYSSLPPRAPPADNVVFSRPSISEGNASFVVESVSGGPYPHTGFRVNLTVNGFSAEPAPLAASRILNRLSIGPNVYVIFWDDADGDGAVSRGDPWIVSGDNIPLPTLSLFEFGLQYQGQWTAKAFWSTT